MVSEQYARLWEENRQYTVSDEEADRLTDAMWASSHE